jgi:integrase/recombinase XerD
MEFHDDRPRTDLAPRGVSGPLAEVAGAFGEALAGKGYSARSAGELMGLAAKLSRWLQSRDLGIADVTAAVIEEFFAARRRDGCARWRTSRSLALLAGCMGIAPGGTGGGLLARYRDYLLAERGLAASTADRYLRLAAAFLAWLPGGEEGVAGLEADQVLAYVMEECPRHGGARAKLIVTALRSLLRFLHADRRVGTALADAVPAAARRRAVRLPAALKPADIQRLLNGCDRSAGLGARDYAVILAMARLGLRAGEVASLRIADVNWREGLLAVRGKGNRHDLLPLPADVGHAMAGYLTLARPGRPASPYLFTCVVAPYGPLHAGSVGGIVSRACRRAGIPAFGPHRLRHALACDLLARGAALEEVAQLLRHGDLTTTAVYARADLARLAELAQPCPQGVLP